MRIRGLLFLGSLAAVASFTVDHPSDGGPADRSADHIRGLSTVVDILGFDGTQRTCALFVALRAAALEDPAVFGGDTDAVEVHWNTCTSGTMVACRPVPQANGDTLQMGIQWSLPAKAGL